MWQHIRVSAPGRLCLFGEHQDFLGLAVIATAINLDITIEARPRHRDGLIRLHLPDIAQEDEFPADRGRPYRHKRDYLPSAWKVVTALGHEVPPLEATVRGTIPLNSGTSSSSALVVAWVSVLLAAATGEAPDPLLVARLAHQAEVLEFNEPGGMMDHYTSAAGGLLHLDCHEPITVQPLAARLDGFVLADSRVRKPTTTTLLRTRVFVKQAIGRLRRDFPDFDLRTAEWEEIAPAVLRFSQEERLPLYSQFVNRDLCCRARQMLATNGFDPAELGDMLLEHQRHLRDGVQVSHPRLDELVEAAVAAGALGGKLNGSGGGGAMFAYAPGRQREVAAALEQAGGATHLISPRGGVTVEIT